MSPELSLFFPVPTATGWAQASSAPPHSGGDLLTGSQNQSTRSPPGCQDRSQPSIAAPKALHALVTAGSTSSISYFHSPLYPVPLVPTTKPQVMLLPCGPISSFLSLATQGQFLCLFVIRAYYWY